jgi:hypothetical protein
MHSGGNSYRCGSELQLVRLPPEPEAPTGVVDSSVQNSVMSLCRLGGAVRSQPIAISFAGYSILAHSCMLPCFPGGRGRASAWDAVPRQASSDDSSSVHVEAMREHRLNMRTSHGVAALLVLSALAFSESSLLAQRASDSTPAADTVAHAAAGPAWRNQARYGGGPSVGAPPSDFMGKAPPSVWCLASDGPGGGDLSPRGTLFKEVSRSWLRQVLSDTGTFGQGWRKVLGGAPTLSPRDSIIEVTDEKTCQQAAQNINRDVLGWQVGPPPVVIFRVGEYLIAYPSNARLGEFGYAVGMSRDLVIRGVAGW